MHNDRKICRQLKISRHCIYDRYETVATRSGFRRPTIRQVRLIKLEQIHDEINSSVDLPRYANTNVNLSISVLRRSVVSFHNTTWFHMQHRGSQELHQSNDELEPDWCIEHLFKIGQR